MTKLKQLHRKPRKNSEASTEFEAMTPRYRCEDVPTELWSLPGSRWRVRCVYDMDIMYLLQIENTVLLTIILIDVKPTMDVMHHTTDTSSLACMHTTCLIFSFIISKFLSIVLRLIVGLYAVKQNSNLDLGHESDVWMMWSISEVSRSVVRLETRSNTILQRSLRVFWRTITKWKAQTI